MSFRDNIQSPEVWREALFKFLFCWVLTLVMMQGLYHFTDMYDVEPYQQMIFALGVGTGNFIMTLIKPQSNN